VKGRWVKGRWVKTAIEHNFAHRPGLSTIQGARRLLGCDLPR
jgi:hypothetical protein